MPGIMSNQVEYQTGANYDNIIGGMAVLGKGTQLGMNRVDARALASFTSCRISPHKATMRRAIQKVMMLTGG